MAKKEITVCDTIECRTLADSTCCICEKDGCAKHATQIDLGIFVAKRISETSAPTISINDRICDECRNLVYSLTIVDGNAGDMHPDRRVILGPVVTALLEHFDLMWTTVIAELKAAKAADTLVKTR